MYIFAIPIYFIANSISGNSLVFPTSCHLSVQSVTRVILFLHGHQGSQVQ